MHVHVHCNYTYTIKPATAVWKIMCLFALLFTFTSRSSRSWSSHERLALLVTVVVVTTLSHGNHAQSDKPHTTTGPSEFHDTDGDLFNTTIIAIISGAAVVMVCVLVLLLFMVTTAVVVKRRRGSYSLSNENEYQLEQSTTETVDVNITPPLPPRTTEMFQLIDLECSPLSPRKSPPPQLPPRTTEMFELINYSPSFSDRSSATGDENESHSATENQDHFNQDVSTSTDVTKNEEYVSDTTRDSPIHPPPIPQKPSSSKDPYYNMSAVVAATNPELIDSTPPPLPSKPMKQSHNPPALPPKPTTISTALQTSVPHTSTEVDTSLDELPESDRQCLQGAIDKRLNFESTGTESCDVGVTSEESLDMWPPVIPKRTQEMFFVATKDEQNKLHDFYSDGINLEDNVAYKQIQ